MAKTKKKNTQPSSAVESGPYSRWRILIFVSGLVGGIGVLAHLAGVRWVKVQVDRALEMLDARHPNNALKALRLARSVAQVLGVRDTQLAYSYARALMESNRTRAASEAFRAITVSQPAFWPAHANYGSALLELGEDLTGALVGVQEAIELLEEEDSKKLGQPTKRVIDGDSANPAAAAVVVSHEHLAELYLQKGAVLFELPVTRCAGGSCREYAAQALRQAQIHAEAHARAVGSWRRFGSSGDKKEEEGDSAAIATHATASKLLARVTTDMASQQASSKGYIESLFDEYAPTFEASLVGDLGYDAPRLLKDAVETALIKERKAVVLEAATPRTRTEDGDEKKKMQQQQQQQQSMLEEEGMTEEGTAAEAMSEGTDEDGGGGGSGFGVTTVISGEEGTEEGALLSGHVLDCGCGTGLAGAAIRILMQPQLERGGSGSGGGGQQLVGVDLSSKMAAVARERRVTGHDRKVYDKVYDKVFVGDLEALLLTKNPATNETAQRDGGDGDGDGGGSGGSSTAVSPSSLLAIGGPFEVVLFADVLIYMGDIEGVLRSAAAALVPRLASSSQPRRRGLIALTLELPSAADRQTLAQEMGDDGWRWKLEGSGRYSHNPNWVKQIASEAGLAVVIHELIPQLRKEKGKPIEGSLFVLGN